MKGFFITGTDTDVGKTWFMLKFGELLIENNIKFHYLKPVESGCEIINNQPTPNDALQFSKLENVSLDKICKYKFKAYASPPKAAQLENREIELKNIIKFIESNKLTNSKHYNLIEGCGGFFSPIAKGKLSSDLAVELNLPVILVVKNILGCINHTLMSLKSIENLNLKTQFIVLNDTKENTILDNYQELSSFTNIPIIKLGYNKKIKPVILKYLK